QIGSDVDPKRADRLDERAGDGRKAWLPDRGGWPLPGKAFSERVGDERTSPEDAAGRVDIDIIAWWMHLLDSAERDGRQLLAGAGHDPVRDVVHAGNADDLRRDLGNLITGESVRVNDVTNLANGLQLVVLEHEGEQR